MAHNDDHGSISTVLLQLLGAAAGLVVLVTLLGSLANWARFDTLDLPNNAAIATLSQTTLLLTGATALALPAAFGLLAAGASVMLRRHPRGWSWDWTIGYILLLGALVLTLVLLALIDGTAWYWPLYAGSAGLLLFVTGVHKLSTTAVAYTVFFALIAIGALAAAIQILTPPTHLERATVFFTT